MNFPFVGVSRLARGKSLVRAGNAARDSRNWPLAIACYREVVAANPANVAIRVQLGHAHKEAGQFALAAEQYQAALANAPDDDDVHLQIGHLRKLMGDLPSARWHYARSFALNPANEHARIEEAALAHVPIPEAPAMAPPAVEPVSVAQRSALQIGQAGAPEPAMDPWTLRAAGDAARDARLWADAMAAYEAYLRLVPQDVAIWVQFGHALKESGTPRAAEQAYRAALALAPEDADVHLQLGHVLKLLDRLAPAIEAYERSFALLPSLAVANELAAVGVEFDIPLEPVGKTREPMLFLEISDLFAALLDSDTISGIQRVQLGLLAFALRTGKPGHLRCRFVTWHRDVLWMLDEAPLQVLVDHYDRTGGREFDRRSELVRGALAGGIMLAPVGGDIVVSTGVLYRRPDVAIGHERLKRAGVRLGAYIHDFIPLTHAEYCDRKLTDEFSPAMTDAFLHLDFVLTVSEHVAGETRRLLKEAGFPLVPIQAVPEAHGFGSGAGADIWTSRIAGLQGSEFVLCVGTISAHKNQALLVQAWQLLLREGRELPDLVLVGRRGHAVRDMFAQLEASAYLGGRVRVIEGLSDDELNTLYRNCLFTMFPSIVEGWGLPVGESLAQGKLCITSRTASMPEVGGDFALYIDPFNVRGAADAVARLLDERGELARLEKRIRTAFRPRTWHDHGESLLQAGWRLGRAEPAASARPLPVRLQPRRLVSSARFPAGWTFGTRLPKWRVAADMALRRIVLAKGWHTPETWGTWMNGAAGTLWCRTEAREGERVRLVLQLRAAVWARGNLLEITASCGATSTIAVPESVGPRYAWPRFLALLDCTAGPGGSVTLDLRVRGGIPAGWWGETRRLCVGLIGLLYVPLDDDTDRLEPNRIVPAAGLVAGNGALLQLRGTASVLLAAQRRAFLVDGWHESEPWGTWMAGRRALIRFPVKTAPGGVVRVVLLFRIAVGQNVQVAAQSACGARTATQFVAGDARDQQAWIDCTVGADRAISVELQLGAHSHDAAAARGPALGLRALAYGPAGSPAERAELAYALQFPAPVGYDRDAAQAVEADLRFTVAGHMNGSYSLAVVNRTLALSLETASPGSVRVLQVEGEPVSDLSQVAKAEHAALATLAKRPAHDGGLEIVIAQHYPLWVPIDPCELAVAFFAWEEGVVPLDLVRVLNARFNAVLVQTRFIRKALVDSGVTAPIRVMGCAVDLADYAAIGARRAGVLPRPNVSMAAPFTFLHVSSCFPRKGVDALLLAYARAFRRADPVRLVIKGFPNPHNDVAAQIARLYAIDPDAPEIIFINADSARHAVLRLYEEADAVVLPTRGEGFNLPAAEALAAGVPLIVTGHSGQRDFADATVARQVGFNFARSASHMNSSASVWAEPDVADLAAAMRAVLAAPNDKTAARIVRGRKVAEAVGDTAAWARRVRAITIDLLGVQPPEPPKVAWVSSWNTRCGIATHSQYLLEHYPDADRYVTVLCDARTPAHGLAAAHGPKVQHGWTIGDAASIARLPEEIDRLGARVVVVQHQPGLISWSNLAGLLLDGRLAGRVIVVVLHNAQELLHVRESALAIDALRRADRVLVHCVRDLNTMKSFGLIENVTLLPPGAIPPRGEGPTLRTLSRGSPAMIGCYGFFLPKKGIDTVIESFARLRRTWPHARLRLVCSEFPADVSREEIARCRALARRLNIASCIEWHNDFLPDEESLALLADCDLVVLPYQDTQEAASGAMRVAMASRVPVLTTPIAIFEEAGEAVLRAAAGDGAAVHAAMDAALGDRELRLRTVERAEAWLAEHDWARMMERTRGIMLGLLASGPEHDPADWPPEGAV